MREYFRSPYVVIGVIGVVYYLYRRNILINELLAKNLPAINDLFNEKEDNVVVAKTRIAKNKLVFIKNFFSKY